MKRDIDPADLPAGRGETGTALLSLDAAIFKDIQVALEAKLGTATLTIEELLALRAGSVVKLDLRMNEPIEVRLNSATVARGVIVAVDDHFGVRITDVAAIK